MTNITKHCRHQMNTRNITQRQLDECVTNGVKLVNKTDSNKWTIIDNKQGLYVVTSKCMTIAVTTFWKGR